MNKEDRVKLQKSKQKINILYKGAKRFYSRFDKRLKSKYPHFVTREDFKRVLSKDGKTIFYTKKKTVTGITRC